MLDELGKQKSSRDRSKLSIGEDESSIRCWERLDDVDEYDDSLSCNASDKHGGEDERKGEECERRFDEILRGDADVEIWAPA